LANKIANNKGMNKKKNRLNLLLKIIGGLFIGFCNGFFGGGGGMLAVPFMLYVLKEEEKISHATAIFIILPLSVISGTIYILNGELVFSKLLPVMLGIIVGGSLGALFLNKIKGKTVAIIFTILMIVAGIRLVIPWK